MSQFLQLSLLENLALRHQERESQAQKARSRKFNRGRLGFRIRTRSWSGWKIRLRFVQPDTVIRWHRKGFRLFWKWKSRRSHAGRKTIAPGTISLIREMSRANSLWGAPRIHSELLKLGLTVAQRTVAKYMVPRPGRSSTQSWTTFLRNHLGQMVSVDFFTVPTVGFQLLYVFVVLSHQRRTVLHFNVVDAPSARWTAQQLREAFPFTSPPKYVLRDRDSIYGLEFRRCAEALGSEELRIAPSRPWQSPYVERLIGSIRRECLDHVLVFNRVHLHRVLESYFAYYHASRCHLGLDKDAPQGRRVQPAQEGQIVAFPEVGGLHHHYERRAA